MHTYFLIEPWLDKTNIGVIFKKSALITEFISEINNTQVDNTEEINDLMSIYNLR